jgi:hypothetical protein
LTALYWFKNQSTDPLVLKSPSNQSNILDISILFADGVFSFIVDKTFATAANCWFNLLQYKLHLVNWDKKRSAIYGKMNSWFIHFAEDFMFDFL